MMDYGTVNRVYILGYVGKDPDLKTTKGKSSTSFAHFPVSTSEVYRAGQKKTFWWTAVAWGKMAEWVSKYVKKGQLVHIDGSLSYFVIGHGENKNKIIQIKINNLIFVRKAKLPEETASEGAEEDACGGEDAEAPEEVEDDFPDK